MSPEERRNQNLSRITETMSPDYLKYQRFRNLEKQYEALLKYCQELQTENEALSSRVERMKTVLYFTFMLSTLAVLLILEQLLMPILRTL